MRVDKFLKVSRILKRRTVSKELALHQRIQINHKIAKPSTDVKVDDLVTITYGRRQMTVKVLQINNYTKKQDAELMYEVIEDCTLPEATIE